MTPSQSNSRDRKRVDRPFTLLKDKECADHGRLRYDHRHGVVSQCFDDAGNPRKSGTRR